MRIQILLGANIKSHREAKGWSQETLAEKSGLHRTYISQVETGVRNPTVEVVQRIASGLNIAVSDLFTAEKAKGRMK